jgi:O-antigen chain-terminating methyltransferase
MRRIIEKLAQERKEKEEEFARKLKELKEKSQEDVAGKSSFRLEHLFSRLKEILNSEERPQEKKGRRFLSSLSKTAKTEPSQQLFNEQVLLILSEFQNILTQNLNQTKELFSSLTDLLELNSSLADARDREWDALGSNHVGMIFKSMEWRVEKLRAEYEDTKLLMKKFLLLKERLNRLLSMLEKKKAPSLRLVKEILSPIEDWRYAGFENRFRGDSEEVKKQQASYLTYFKKGGRVLDLGCGRGEFMELLKENGIEAMGFDINEEMIDICLDKGLPCQKGDILEKLAECEDGSFSGIFSSQVIEHLPPAYLSRMVELCYFKLDPSGVIVLETINPTSVFALVQIYYLDLSHQKPVHPQALKFLLESAGFEEVEIKYSSPLEEERLQNLPGANESASILNRNIDHLNELLYASPNYAAIAKKI